MLEVTSGATDLTKPLILHRNVFEYGVVTFSNETSEGSGLNCLEDTTYDYWDTVGSTETATVDLGAATSCDCVGIDAHTIGTDGATVAVEYSANNIDWTEIWTHTPTDNSCILGIWPATSARYWRVVVSDGPALIGVIKLGSRVIIPTGVMTGFIGIPHSRKVDLLSNNSITGQFIGTKVIKHGAMTTIDFGLIDREWAEDNLQSFEDDYNNGRAFFFAASPQSAIKDIAYCKRPDGSSELNPGYQEGGVLMNYAFEAMIFADGTSPRM